MMPHTDEAWNRRLTPMDADQRKQSAVSVQLSAKPAPRLKLIAGSYSLTAP
jgi:hypothetical protein